MASARPRGGKGAADRPYLPSSPAHGTTSLGGVGGNWRMEEEDTGGGLVCTLPTSLPPPLGSFSPAPAVGGGGGRQGLLPLPWGGGQAGR